MRAAQRVARALVLVVIATSSATARDVPQVLEQSKAASGGPAVDALKAVRITYRLRQAGLDGTGTTLTDVVTGRTVTHFRLGPLSGAEGFDGRNAWFQDTAGIVTIPEGADRRAQSVSAQYRQALAYWFPNRAVPASLTFRFQLFRSRVKEAIDVAPKDGLPFTLWFDAQTKMLDRVIETGATETRTTIYDDYRPHGPLMIARRILSSNAADAFGTERNVTKIEIDPKFTDADFAAPPPPKPDFAFAGRARSSTVPFRFLNNHIYADVKLNGHVFPMLIDTGGANIITPSTARKLGLSPVGDARVWGTGETSEAASFTRVNDVAIGDIKMRNQLFAVVPLEKLSEVEGAPFYGIIGYELFKRLVVRVDYDARTLLLSDAATWNPAGAGTVIPFVFNGTVPEITGAIDGVPAAFDVDTGSRTSVGLNSPFVMRFALRARFRPSIETVSSWGIGGPSLGTIARVRRLTLGSIPIHDVVVDMSLQRQGILSHSDPAGSIGSGLLKRFIVTFDYPRQKIYLAPGLRFEHRDAYDRAGVWINQTSHGFSVMAVADGSPAAAAGLQVGDTIVAVDAKPASAILLADLRDRFRDAPPGTEFKLTIERRGTSHLIALRLRDLI